MNIRSNTRAFARTAVLNSLLIFLIGVFAARLPSTLAQIGAIGGRAKSGDFFEPISDVYRALMSDYVDVPDAAKLQKGAIDGMLTALNDDYAEYIPEEEVANFEKEMTGHFVGIGCQIEMRDGWLTVVSPLEDSPALAAGILANDRIASVEGKSTFGLTSDECIKMLTGQPDTKVSFLVLRDGKEVLFTIARAPIVNRAVRGLRRRSDDSARWDYLIDPASRIAYVRLSQFTPDAADELEAALEEARTEAGPDGQPGDKIGGLILDLRGNPGGVMDGALAIADMFLEGGTIMSIRGRAPLGGGNGARRASGAGDKDAAVATESFVAQAEGTLPNFPMTVLVNEGSASASEIVSGALSDQKRAIVIGTRTFGKGLVQSVAQLRHDPRAQVKFTTQRYYLPSGRLIQRTDDATEWGVDPTPGFYIPMTDHEVVESFIKRRDWDVLRGDKAPADPSRPIIVDQHWADPVWIRDQALDKQLAAGLEALQTKLTSGEWKPISDAKQMAGKLAERELHDLTKARKLLGLEFARLEKRIGAIERVAVQGGGDALKPEPKDLWSDTLDLTGGQVKVFDKDGHVVATLDVTGRDVERWLLNADVKPMDAPANSPEPAH